MRFDEGEVEEAVMELVWWHWIVLGLLLIGAEALTGTFFMLWFGLGAVATALLVAVLPLGIAAQMMLWAGASIAMTAAWMKWFKNPDRTGSGMAKQGVLGLTGLVSRPIPDLGEGEVMFQRPVLGADRWPALSDEPIAAGVKVRIVDVLGQTLKVERLH